MKTPDLKAYLGQVKVPGSVRVWALAAVCVVLALMAVVVVRASGGGGRVADGQYPQPGTMRLVTVERVEDKAKTGTAQNLLAGGDFRTWWAGAPAPQGVLAPDPGASRLERAEGLRQVWQRPEAPGTMDPRMRLESANLTPGTYELEAFVSGVSGSVIAIGLWAKPANEIAVPLDDEFITVLPGEGQSKRYLRRFTLEKKGTVTVAPHALFGMLPDSRAVWHGMRLTRVGDKG